jgi:hypothetical protein
VCVVVAALGDIVALFFGDVSLVTPLGAFTIVANIFFANWFHGEKLYPRDGIFTGVIICGSIVTTIFAPHEGDAQTDSQIFDKYKSSKFIVYAAIIFFIVIGIFIFIYFAEKSLKRFGQYSSEYKKYFDRFHRVAYPINAGIIGAQAVLFMKTLTQITTAVGGDIIFLEEWQFYVFLVAVGILEILFLTTMNFGLDRWDAVIVVPVFQTFWTLTSVIGAIVIDDEFAGFAECSLGNFNICINGFSLSYIFFPLGLIIAVVGVFLLSMRNSNQHDKHKVEADQASTKENNKKSYDIGSKTASLHEDEDSGSSQGSPKSPKKGSDKKANVWARFKDIELEVPVKELAGLTLEPFVVRVFNKKTQQDWPFTCMTVVWPPMNTISKIKPKTYLQSQADRIDDAVNNEAIADDKNEQTTNHFSDKFIRKHDILCKIDGVHVLRSGWVDSAVIQRNLVEKIAQSEESATIRLLVRRIEGIEDKHVKQARYWFNFFKCFRLYSLAFSCRRIARIEDKELIQKEFMTEPYGGHVTATSATLRTVVGNNAASEDPNRCLEESLLGQNLDVNSPTISVLSL